MAACGLIGYTFNISPLSASIDPSYSDHFTDLEGEVQKEIQNTQKDIDNLLVKLNRVELAPEKGPQRVISTENTQVRKKLKGFLNSAIKMKIKHLEHLKKQKNYLVGDYQISRSLVIPELPKGKTAVSGLFKCSHFPIKNEDSGTLEKLFSFGDFVNPMLGQSSAKTQGIWWGNTFGTLVRACAAGEIILSEFVEGRGHVVAIRHNSRDITLYGNLDASSLKNLKTGTKVPEGAPLGFALERFYFEARRGTEAINPEEIVGQESDVKTAANSKLN